MKRSSFLFSLLVVTFASHFAVAAPNADDKTAPQLLPGSAIIYAEIADPKAVISLIMDHPLHKKLQTFPKYQEYLASADHQKLQDAVKVFETRTGMKWRDALESISAGGIYAAFDLSSTGLAILIKSDDAAKLARFQKSFIDFANEENPGAIQPGRTYRDIETWKVGQGGFATVGKWFLFTNSGAMGKAIFDNMLDEPANALATDRDFKAALTQRQASIAATSDIAGDKPTAYVFARLTLARTFGLLGALTKARSDNPAAELLLGGLQETIKQAPYATAALHLKQDQMRLMFAAPHDGSRINPARAFFFAPEGKGSAPKPLKPAGTLLSVSAYRDVAAMLRNADELFDENVAAGIAQADSQLTLFFSGRQFNSEVLGALKPHMQIIVTQPAFKDVTPAIKIPAFAMIVQLKNPDDITQAQFRTAFHTFLNFVNLENTQKGAPMLLTDIDKIDGTTLLFSRYVFDANKGDRTKADMIYNFSPSMAIVDERIIIASTRILAEELIALAKKEKPDSTIDQNMLIELDGAAALQSLRDNRESLIAQNMLEQGNTPQQAALEIDSLLEVVSHIKSMQFGMTFKDKWATIDLDIKLNLPKK